MIISVDLNTASLCIKQILTLGSVYDIELKGYTPADDEELSFVIADCAGIPIAKSHDGAIKLNTVGLAQLFEQENCCNQVLHCYLWSSSGVTIASGFCTIAYSPITGDLNGEPALLQGVKGDKGDAGADGKDGKDGKDGADGRNGVYVPMDGLYAFHVSTDGEHDKDDHLWIHAQNAKSLYAHDADGNLLTDENGNYIPLYYVNEHGHLIYRFMDNGEVHQLLDLGNVKGAKGDAGKDGVAGKDGADGADGHTPTDEELTNLLSRNINDIASAGSLATGSILDGLSSLDKTIEYIKKNLSELNVGSKNSASMEYVDNAIKNINIPKPDLSGYATEEYVAEKLGEVSVEETDPVFTAWRNNSNLIRIGAETVAADSSVTIGSYAYTADDEAEGAYAVAVGSESCATGQDSVAVGYCASARGRSAVAIGMASANANNSITIGSAYVGEGADGAIHITGGSGEVHKKKAILLGSGFIDSTDTTLFQVENYPLLDDDGKIPSERLNIDVPTLVDDSGAVILGDGANAVDYTEEYDYNYVNRIAIGTNASALEGDHMVVIGADSNGNNNEVIAIGNKSSASGDISIAIGSYTDVSGDASVAIGGDASASGTISTAIGPSATTDGHDSVAVGASAKAEKDYSIAVGGNSSATGAGSTVVGAESNASNNYATALGYNAIASEESSTAVGSYSYALQFSSIAIGNEATANAESSVAIGYFANVAEGASHAVQLGEGTNSSSGTLQFRTYRLVDADGYIPQERIALVSPNGTKYKLVVADDGTLSTAKI